MPVASRLSGSVLTAALAALAATPPTAALASPGPTKPVAHAGAAVRTCELRERRYRTLPSVRPVPFCVARRPAPGAVRGHLLIGPRRVGSGGQNAAMILSNEGRILWYLPGERRIHDVKVVRYRGRPVLAVFRRLGSHRGFYELRDRRYRVIRRIAHTGRHGTDMHDLQTTPAGTAYVGAYRPVRRREGLVTDYVVREIDLRTGRVLFEWRSLDHVPVSASYKPRPSGGRSWDYFHGNSIEPPVPGDPTVIVSSRNTSAVYGIDRRTGRLRWTLGGRRDRLGVGADPFCTQHDVRRLPGGDILVFDNGGSGKASGTGCPRHPARVLRYRLGAGRTGAQLRWSFSSVTFRPGGLFPVALGSARRSRGGTTLVSWGTSGWITEVTRAGDVIHAVRIPASTYRAVRHPWVGRPLGRPRLATRRRDRATVDLWASWNGATEIRRWQVLAGPRSGTLRRVGRPAAFRDLETRLRVRVRVRDAYVAVRALDARGRSLGRSPAVPVP